MGDGEIALAGLRFEDVDELFVITSKMPVRRRTFVFKMLMQETPNAKQAAIDAGFSEKSAEVEGSRLLKDAKVRRALEIGRKRIHDKYLVTAERVVEELARIGFLNPKDAYNENGILKEMKDLPDDVARAVASVEMDELVEGVGDSRTWKGRVSKVKFWDKRGALELLGRKLGMFVDNHKISGSLEVKNVAERLSAARERAKAAAK